MIDDVKEYAMETPEKLIHTIVTKRADAGVVAWDASAPSKTSFVEHMTVSLIQAIETGLMFAQTDGLNEWVVAGPLALTYIRSLPMYSEVGIVQERLGGGLVRCGRLHSKTVYAFRELQDGHAVVGHHGGQKGCVLIIQNGHTR